MQQKAMEHINENKDEQTKINLIMAKVMKC